MRLSNLYLENFKSIQKIDINFEGVNTLIGRNGSGKTTILAILAAFLSGRAIKNINKNFKLRLEVDIDLNDSECQNLNHKLITSKLNKFITIRNEVFIIDFNNEEYNYKNFSLFKKIFGFTAYFSNGSKSMYLSNADVLNWKNTGHFLEVLNLSDSKKVIKNLEVFIQNKVYDTNSDTPGVKIILSIIKELNSYLKVLGISDLISFEPAVGIVFGKNNLSFDKLSSGEKKIVILLMYLSTQYKIPGILIVDEPETNLHAEWQIKLIRFLKAISPNTQIIMASHSPLIALSTEQRGIKVLTRVTGDKYTSIILNSDTSALTIDEILHSVFSVPKIVSSAKEELLDIIEAMQKGISTHEHTLRLEKLSYVVDPMSALGIDIEFTKRRLNIKK